MQSYCYNHAVPFLNDAKSRLFRSVATSIVFGIYLYFVCQPACQPAVRPGSTRSTAPEISHNTGSGGGFTKMLFRKRLIHCAMVSPLILRFLPCSSLSFKRGENFTLNVLIIHYGFGLSSYYVT